MRSTFFAVSRRVLYPRILCLSIFALLLPSASAQENLRSQLQPFVDRHELAGAVMMAGDATSVQLMEAIGFADIAVQKQMSSENVFRIASYPNPGRLQQSTLTHSAMAALMQPTWKSAPKRAVPRLDGAMCRIPR